MSCLRHCELSVLLVSDGFYGALNDAKDPVHVACTNNVRTRLLVQVFLQVFLFVPWFHVILTSVTDMTGMRQGGTLCTRLFVLFLYQQAAVNIMEECG